ALGFELPLDQAYGAIVEPPQFEMGHFAFGCFRLAKEMKKGPPMIAAELASHIQADEIIAKINAAGPYLNFILTGKAYGELVVAQVLNGEFFKREVLAHKPKTMIEYSQP